MADKKFTVTKDHIKLARNVVFDWIEPESLPLGRVVMDRRRPYGDYCRFLTQTELELAQTVPVGYTSCVSYNQAQDLLGDGWTVDVVAHILGHMRSE